MSDANMGKKLKGKDLITIGIFSAIYFVINFAFMLLGGIHPVLWMLMPGFIAVFAGIPFLLIAYSIYCGVTRMRLRRFNLHKTNAANEELVISLFYGREVQERKPIYQLLHHYTA